jgi:hypothetical protein
MEIEPGPDMQWFLSKYPMLYVYGLSPWGFGRNTEEVSGPPARGSPPVENPETTRASHPWNSATGRFVLIAEILKIELIVWSTIRPRRDPARLRAGPAKRGGKLSSNSEK